MTKIKAVVFDLDGTLFDTRPVMHIAGNNTLKKLKLPTFPEERYGFFSGGGIEEFVFGILDAAGDTAHKNYEIFWETYLDEASKLGDMANIKFPGIDKLINTLNENNIKCAVLSNKDHLSCVNIIESCFEKGKFSAVFGNTIGFPPKPDPAGMNKLISDLKVEKENVIYLGDTEIDMQTAKNSNVPIIAALWGYRTKEMLDIYSPDFYASTPEEVLNIIM